jgi:hypothetical protein
MGYTHYWTLSQSPRTQRAAVLETQYQKAILECQKVVQKLAKHNREVFGSSLLSGFTAHCKPGQYGGLGIGGTRDDGGESFNMREHFNQNDTHGFCKTNRASYDTAVIACLAVLKYRLKENFHVSSDGGPEEWNVGVQLARNVLNRKIPNPIHNAWVASLKITR